MRPRQIRGLARARKPLNAVDGGGVQDRGGDGGTQNLAANGADAPLAEDPLPFEHNVTNFASPKLVVRSHPEKRGRGVFAAAAIAKGEVLAIWGGELVTGARFRRLSAHDRSFGFQVEDEVFLVTTSRRHDVADLVNHSCEPNAGLSGQITLVAMRDIAAGEEICFDYAMTDSTPLLEFDCRCGSDLCRGRVSASDWRRPDLQRRYAGYFSAYLLRRIEQDGPFNAGVIEFPQLRVCTPTAGE